MDDYDYKQVKNKEEFKHYLNNMISKITKVLNRFKISQSNFQTYGNDCAKLELVSKKCAKPKNKKLILVTAMSPTPTGEGKTTIAIGLNDALNKFKYKSILCLRQPSIGPTLGVKGGATGNGKSQVVPEQLINYGLTGDFYVIETINNLIASVIDNSIYQGNSLNINPKTISWRRTMDLSDRSLRDIEIYINKLNKYHTGFDITAASDIMVILCLSKNIDDFIEKINNIVIGYDFKNNPVYVRNFNLDRSIKILAANLIKPNCLLTKENNLCLMHGGPFANIAHGCNSIIALNESFNYADYVVTEAGFGSDLGFEKFVDIIGREYNVPDAVVLCVTTKSIFYHSNKCKDWKEQFDIGLKNLIQHINLIKWVGYNPIVAINKFANDKKEQISYLSKWLKAQKVRFAICDPVITGVKSFDELTKLVVDETKKTKKIKFVYELNDSLATKIQNIVTSIYGLNTKAKYEDLAKLKLKKFNNFKYYVCMAKTPITFSSDKNDLVYNKQNKIVIKDILVSTGAKLIIPVCESIFRMPGLPKIPNAQK